MKVYEIITENALKQAAQWIIKYYDDIKRARGIATANNELLKRIEPFIEKSADDYAEAVVKSRQAGKVNDPKLYDHMDKILDPSIKNDPDKLKAVLDEISKRSKTKIDDKMKAPPSGATQPSAQTTPVQPSSTPAQPTIARTGTARKITSSILYVANALMIGNEVREYFDKVGKLDEKDPSYDEKVERLRADTIRNVLAPLILQSLAKRGAQVALAIPYIATVGKWPKAAEFGFMLGTKAAQLAALVAWESFAKDLFVNTIGNFVTGAMIQAYKLIPALYDVAKKGVEKQAEIVKKQTDPETATPVVGQGSIGKGKFFYGQKAVDDDGTLSNDYSVLSVIADDPDFKRDLANGRNPLKGIPRKPGEPYPGPLMKRLGLD